MSPTGIDWEKLERELNPPPKSLAYRFGLLLGEVLIRWWPLLLLILLGMVAYLVLK
jgi:hypothetical protein